MEYYKTLMAILIVLVVSVIVQDGALFGDVFFALSYAAMSAVLLIGGKNDESFRVDAILGCILLFSLAFLSTMLFVEVLVKRAAESFLFKLGILSCLDLGGMMFLRGARDLCKEEKQ